MTSPMVASGRIVPRCVNIMNDNLGGRRIVKKKYVTLGKIQYFKNQQLLFLEPNE
jgi:hypothetical protein